MSNMRQESSAPAAAEAVTERVPWEQRPRLSLSLQSTSTRHWPRRLGWGLVALSAAGIALVSAWRYLLQDPTSNRIPLNPEVARHYLWLTLHALPGSLALLIGPFLFPQGFRARRPAWHRNLGRLYLLSVLMGCVMSVLATFASTSGFVIQVSFLLLAVSWLFSGAQAYRTARAKRFDVHRVWMIRNYALTFTAVALRVFFGIGLAYTKVSGSSLSFSDIYTASAWSAVLLCPLVAEWFIVPLPSRVART